MSDRPLALVTGASSGIGEAYADALADRGHCVLAVARRAERLDALAARHPGRVVPFVADLSRPGAVDDVVARAGELGPVELLVSNAGSGVLGPLAKLDPADVRQMVELNVTAGAELVTRLLPGMLDRGSGGIVVVSSSGAFYPIPYLAAYTATKAFLLSFAESLSLETAGTGVHVMALCPGATRTEFGEVAGFASGTIENAPGAMDSSVLVAHALRAFERGRTLCVPGAVTRTVTTVLARTPRALRPRVLGALFRG